MRDKSVPQNVAPIRVVAALAHNPNVRKGEVRDGSVRLYLSNSGIGHTVLQHLRSLGYEIVSISPRFGTVRCVPTQSSVVAPDHDSAAVKYHRGRLMADGGHHDTWRCPKCDFLNPGDWDDCRDCQFVRSDGGELTDD